MQSGQKSLKEKILGTSPKMMLRYLIAKKKCKKENRELMPKDLFQYKPNSRWPEAYAYLIQLLYGDIL